MPVPQNCQIVNVKSDKCCYKTTIETVAGNEDIGNVTFPDNPNAYDHHVVQFDDNVVIYEFFGGSWGVKLKEQEIIDSEMDLKVFLRGPYSAGTMTTTLATNTLIPVDEPYEGLGYERVFYKGESVADTSVFTANTITDWILVELRDKNNPEVIKYNRAALLKNNGDILDVDGITPITFESIIEDDYYVSIRHRNHMGVMTAEPVSVTTTVTIDFSDPLTDLWGVDAAYNNSGVINLWACKYNVEGFSRYEGSMSFLSYLTNITTNLTVTLNSVYSVFDVNLNGTVNAGPVNSDRTTFLSNINSHPLNSPLRSDFTFYEQIPSRWLQSLKTTITLENYFGTYNTYDLAGTAFYSENLLASKNYEVKYYGKTAIRIPTGIDAERPPVVEAGLIRHSTTSNKPEYHNGTSWVTIGAEPTYKVYRALITQSGTNAPTAIVLENTLGGTPVWSHFDVGIYRLTLAGAFTVDKTFIITGFSEGGLLSSTYYTMKKNSNSTNDFIEFEAAYPGNFRADSIITDLPLQILVYP